MKRILEMEEACRKVEVHLPHFGHCGRGLDLRALRDHRALQEEHRKPMITSHSVCVIRFAQTGAENGFESRYFVIRIPRG